MIGKNGSKEAGLGSQLRLRLFEKDYAAIQSSLKDLNLIIGKYQTKTPSVKAASEACMHSRALSTKVTSYWLWEKRFANPEVGPDAIKALRQAVVLVGRTSPKSAPLARRVKFYRRNEFQRLIRLQSLHYGLYMFNENIENYRDTNPDYRTKNSRAILPYISESLFEDQKELGRSVNALLLDLCRRVYTEVNQFLLEIQKEASPYKDSAVQQGSLGWDIYSCCRKLLNEIKDKPVRISAKSSEVIESLDLFLKDILSNIVRPLQDAGENLNEGQSGKVFSNIKQQEKEIRYTMHDILRRMSEIVRGVTLWSHDEESEFLSLAGRFPNLDRNSEEEKKFEGMQAKRRVYFNPLTPQEYRVVHSNEAARDTLLKDLRAICEVE